MKKLAICVVALLFIFGCSSTSGSGSTKIELVSQSSNGNVKKYYDSENGCTIYYGYSGGIALLGCKNENP